MRYLFVLCMVGCYGGTVSDPTEPNTSYTIEAPPTPIHPLEQKACVLGKFALSWHLNSQSADALWCSSVAFPANQTLDVGTTFDLLGCKFQGDGCAYKTDCTPTIGSWTSDEVAFKDQLVATCWIDGETRNCDVYFGMLGVVGVEVQGTVGICFIDGVMGKE